MIASSPVPSPPRKPAARAAVSRPSQPPGDSAAPAQPLSVTEALQRIRSVLLRAETEGESALAGLPESLDIRFTPSLAFSVALPRVGEADLPDILERCRALMMRLEGHASLSSAERLPVSDPIRLQAGEAALLEAIAAALASHPDHQG